MMIIWKSFKLKFVSWFFLSSWDYVKKVFQDVFEVQECPVINIPCIMWLVVAFLLPVFNLFRFFSVKITRYIYIAYSRFWLKIGYEGWRLHAGLSSPGVPGVPWNPQILVDQLTLSQPRGTDYAHLITTGNPGFSDLPTAL